MMASVKREFEIGSDSDSDSDGDFEELSRNHAKQMKRIKCPFHFQVNDDVSIRGLGNFQVVAKTQTIRRGYVVSVYNLLHHDTARPGDQPMVVDKAYMCANATPLEYTPVVTELTPALQAAAHRDRVRVSPSTYGFALYATCDLSEGHLIAYGGRLSATQRPQGKYNCSIYCDAIGSCFVIADQLNDRGPGAIANDCTVLLGETGEVHPTGVLPNAGIWWNDTCELNKAYLVDWNARRNDGTRFKLYIRLNRDVKTGEEISLCYGDETYWKNVGIGECMSDPIHVS